MKLGHLKESYAVAHSVDTAISYEPLSGWITAYKKIQPFLKDFSRTTLDFQGLPTRSITSA